MNYTEALAAAEQHFNHLKKTGVTYALDAKTHWIFYGGIEGKVEYGGAGIKIEKETGKMEDFLLPNEENFKLLEQAEKR